MLRLAVALLLLVNIVFYAWTQGWLDDVVGVRAAGDHEPERMSRQVRPELVRILPPQLAASAAPAAASQPGGTATTVTSAATSTATSTAAPACLEAGPFAADEIGGADAALQAAMPADSRGGWTTVKLDRSTAWLVYMGKYPNRDALLKKADELKRRGVRYDEVRSPPALDGGLSLGRFEDRAGAEKALASFGQQGIHTARVVEINPGTSSYVLRAAAADSTLAARLTALKLDALGKGFVACAKPPAN